MKVMDNGPERQAIIDRMVEMPEDEVQDRLNRTTKVWPIANVHIPGYGRDAMMADRLATVAGRAGGVLIAGNGHVRTDRGVPWYLARIRPTARTVSSSRRTVRSG